MRVSKKDDEIIDALARTRTVKKIAEFLHEDFSEQKLADLVAAIIFFKIRGEEEDQGFDFFMKVSQPSFEITLMLLSPSS